MSTISLLRYYRDLFLGRVDSLLDAMEDRTRCWECRVDGRECGRECRYSSRPVSRNDDRSTVLSNPLTDQDSETRVSYNDATFGYRPDSL
jgi:hypothetical protein